jgi:hypothetical protein
MFICAGFASFSCATLHDSGGTPPWFTNTGEEHNSQPDNPARAQYFQAEPLSYPKAHHLATLAILKSWYDQG